jgi:hypothetical protein
MWYDEASAAGRGLILRDLGHTVTRGNEDPDLGDSKSVACLC